jgi:hypothetical protein
LEEPSLLINQRTLGRTGFRVSEIGLGFEHLKRQKLQTIVAVVNQALENGINYLDLVWSLPSVLEGVKTGIEGRREKVFITAHLGSGHKNGRYCRSREADECEKFFDDALNNLDTDHADVANIHYVKDREAWKQVNEGGVVDLACRLKKSGRARAVGISTHDIRVIHLAAGAGLFDVVMYQVNIANHGMQGRDEALKECVERGIGIVAMKPFAGGKLLERGQNVLIPRYKTGGVVVKTKIPLSMTPMKCLSYTLSQIGVCTTVVGISNLNELKDILAYPQASKRERDYSMLLKKVE